MAKVLLLSLASALVTAQQPRFIQRSDFSQQANFDVPTPIDPTISFNYGYEINDKDTGNAQTHQEALENGVLRGSYSVVQPDGRRRIVEYEADEISGFQAKVRYELGYPIQSSSQSSPSAGGAASQQGTRLSSSSSSNGSSPRGSRPNPPSQGTRFPGSSQIHRFTGVSADQQQRFSADQQQRFSAGTPQGPGFRPTIQGSPSGFNGAPQSGAQRPRVGPGSSSLSTSVSSQAGQSSPAFSGPGHRVGPRPVASGSPRPGSSVFRQQGAPFSSPGSRPQADRQPVSPGSPRPGPSAIRPVGVPFSSQPNTQAELAVQIAPIGSFSQRGTPSSPAFASQAGRAGTSNAGISGAAFDAASQAGIRGAPFGALAQDGSSRSAFQQDRSSSRIVAGAPTVSIQSSNAFQSERGSRFAAGPAFNQLIASSLLVTDENLDSIDAVELASAGFGDSARAYRLVSVPVNN